MFFWSAQGPLPLILSYVLFWANPSPSAPSVSLQQFYFSPVVTLTPGSVFRHVWVDVCRGVLVICVLVFTVFCIVCTVFLYCFVYVY
jgi:hypothetical protein